VVCARRRKSSSAAGEITEGGGARGESIGVGLGMVQEGKENKKGDWHRTQNTAPGRGPIMGDWALLGGIYEGQSNSVRESRKRNFNAVLGAEKEKTDNEAVLSLRRTNFH